MPGIILECNLALDLSVVNDDRTKVSPCFRCVKCLAVPPVKFFSLVFEIYRPTGKKLTVTTNHTLLDQNSKPSELSTDRWSTTSNNREKYGHTYFATLLSV